MPEWNIKKIYHNWHGIYKSGLQVSKKWKQLFARALEVKLSEYTTICSQKILSQDTRQRILNLLRYGHIMKLKYINFNLLYLQWNNLKYDLQKWSYSVSQESQFKIKILWKLLLYCILPLLSRMNDEDKVLAAGKPGGKKSKDNLPCLLLLTKSLYTISHSSRMLLFSLLKNIPYFIHLTHWFASSKHVQFFMTQYSTKSRNGLGWKAP